MEYTRTTEEVKKLLEKASESIGMFIEFEGGEGTTLDISTFKNQDGKEVLLIKSYIKK